MSLVLAGTADSITYVLDAAPATNQLPASIYYALQGGAGNQANTVSNGVTPVTILAGSVTAAIVVNSIFIPNRDTATRIVTVNMVTGSGTFEQVQVTLASGSHLNYSSASGWSVLDKNGNFLSTVAVTSGTVTANQGTPAAIANAWPVEVTDGTNVLGTSAHPIRTDPTGTTTQPVSLTSTTITGTVGVTQSTTPWADNISQWGGAATTLGQKVSASSVPVVLASDQSIITIQGAATSIGANIISGTTAVAIGATTAVAIRSVTVFSQSAVIAAGSVVMRLMDGGGTTRLAFLLPAQTATGYYGPLIEHFEVNIPLVNGGVSATIVLAANLSSGSYYVSLSFN